MRMLRWISGNIWKDKIRNEDIRLKIAVAPSDEKMRENLLKWFGHVQRRASNEQVRKSKMIQVEGMNKRRGRPKIILEVIEKTCQLGK